MIRIKRTAILIEEERFLKITLHSHGSLAWCKECGEHVNIVKPEEAAEIVRVSPRAIYALIERDAVHFQEFDGELAICIRSLLMHISSEPGHDSKE